MADVNETVTVLENLTAGDNVTVSIPAGPESKVFAYSWLFLMAVLPIIVGAFRSVKHLSHQKATGIEVETISGKDAMWFPIYASGALFGIYMIFRIFDKDYVNMLLAFYFFLIGVVAIGRIVSPIFRFLIGARISNPEYNLRIKECSPEEEEVTSFNFDIMDIAGHVLAAGFGLWYLLHKHWVANNIFGLAFATNGVEFLQLNTIKSGCILLSGLFFYDIFWVFGTDVMISVAQSFEAPIKVVFPQDIFENGLAAKNFAMLGLGDIVIPGIFIALLLRFDVSLSTNRKTYFYSSFIAYILGLVLTIVVMLIFKHPQPALLYLVPCCLGIPLCVGFLKGELPLMFAYADNPEEKTPAKEELKTD